jgi:cytochrome o ubiquinol oxidase operon protein cyoD
MAKSVSNAPVPEASHATVQSYVIGYVLSLGLTLTAYFLVYDHTLSYPGAAPYVLLVPLLIALALGQFIVQLLFFFHLGRETKPRWKLVVFFMMIGIVCILVFGSLWIMSNLNYHMTTTQINNYMNQQDGF